MISIADGFIKGLGDAVLMNCDEHNFPKPLQQHII